jgi:small subunit ribosomal protein S9
MTTTTTAAAIPANPAAQPVKAAAAPRNGYWWGTGRRKTAVARVRIKPGSGKFLVNGREVDAYFTEPQYRNDVNAPLRVTDMSGKLDVLIKVEGGGTTGQAGAVVVGIARALKSYDPQLEGALRTNGYRTTDDRQVERKKYGRAGARRRFQFSKR